MNLETAFDIVRPLGAPASVDQGEAEEQIFVTIIERWPNASVMRICEAIGAGQRVFALSRDLSAALDAAAKRMEAQ